MYVCMYVIILNRFFGGIWAFLEAKTEKEYGYPIFHLFHFGDQQIDIFYVAKLNTKKWWCAGGGGGVGGGGGCLQGLHMFYSLASDVKSFCISVSLLGSFSLVFYPQPSHPSCLSMW